MKKVIVEFEETFKSVRTIICNVEDDADIDFADYVNSAGDDLETIADRMREDGIEVIELSDIISDFENSDHDDIDYQDDRTIDEEDGEDE